MLSRRERYLPGESGSLDIGARGSGSSLMGFVDMSYCSSDGSQSLVEAGYIKRLKSGSKSWCLRL
jgi:hypothetical protein